MRVAVVGHVEWVEFARVPALPPPGQIEHACEHWAEPAGGGAVAAVVLAGLAGGCDFFCALGDDEEGERSREILASHGVTVHAARRAAPTRRAWTHVTPDGERTITVMGARLAARGEDPLPWDLLARCDAVYVTAGDPATLRHARAARTLVVSPRAQDALAGDGVPLDVLVHSARDETEARWAAGIEAALVVSTHGPDGGSWRRAGGETGRWAAAELPGPVADEYGAGDSFAAGLTYALGRGDDPAAACATAARCGARALTRTGALGR